jgi:hypothetical protein
VCDVRAPEAVDRLVLVADDAEVGVRPVGELVDEAVLDVVGVLVLIDHDIAIALLVAPLHLGDILEESRRCD